MPRLERQAGRRRDGDESRARSIASRRGSDAPVVLETSGCRQALRRHRRRQRPAHRSSARARSPPSSGRTAPARPRCSTCSPAPSRPTRGSVKLNGEELVGLNPTQVARKGLVRSFQDVRLFNRLSCLQNVMMAVQHQAGENFATLAFAHRKVVAGRGADANAKAMDWLGFVGMAEFADVPAGAPLVRADQAGLAGAGAGHRGRGAPARRAGFRHRHQVGRHHPRPDRGGPRAGPHRVRRRAQPARRRPARRSHVLHGARRDHGRRARSPS